jgi:hypothetical protein
MTQAFTWWHVVDGVAVAHPDTTEVRAMIDAGAPNWFGSIEGAIIHGGVQAVAYRRDTVETFDALAWIERGERVPVGTITITEYTAGKEHVDAA